MSKDFHQGAKVGPGAIAPELLMTKCVAKACLSVFSAEVSQVKSMFRSYSTSEFLLH